MNNTQDEEELFTEVSLKDTSGKKKKKAKKDGGIGETIRYLVFVIVVSWLIITFVTQRTEVQGSSMEPHLHNGENIMVDKLSYRFHDPERFDIIVFRYLYKKNTFYIKRVIGLPGETVQIADGVIYINGEPLEEDYGLEEITNPGRALEPITLGEDEYFVLGDNRIQSYDSRQADVGPLKKADFRGKIQMVVTINSGLIYFLFMIINYLRL